MFDAPLLKVEGPRFGTSSTATAMYGLPHAWLRTGLIIRLGSFWVGAHWSRFNKRLCLNLIPCVTLWLVFDDGHVP